MSKWATPLSFVRENNGKLRFCTNYMKLNSISVKDTYNLSHMDACINTLCDSQY